MTLGGLPEHIRNTLKLIAKDPIAMEQYADFLRNRSFRETLLCREEIGLTRGISWDVLRGLHVAAELRPENESPKIAGASAEGFLTVTGGSVSSSDPVLKAALWRLSQAWPRPVRFEALVPYPVADFRAGRSKCCHC